MAVTKEFFGTAANGEKIYRYMISGSGGLQAGVINYGAILVNLFAPDKDGRLADVVLGFDTLEPYFENGCFFGATVGPNANRIGGASFTLNGQQYQLEQNDGGNNLHSHSSLGYHKRIFTASEGENSVSFQLEDADGCMGFPGNKKVKVTYTVTDANELQIRYEVKSDRDTIINMTNHSYFNLAGHDAGTICNHVLKLQASAYTPVVEGSIPTGEILPVKGTPFDFTEGRRIGEKIDEENDQLKIGSGYDHNLVLDGYDGTLREFAEVREEASGRVMKAYTDLPGVQFYAGNCITPMKGKKQALYGQRCGLCLETQYFPDTANKPQFPSAVFGPGKDYESVTVYQFFTK